MDTAKAIQLLHRLQDEQFDGIHGDERREALEMAVRALEGDGDTISRKAAMVVFENSGLDDDSKDTVVRVLEQLPSAQFATDINVGDKISRKWLMECVNEGWIKFDTEKDENIFIHLVRDIAPSAQPEILACGSGELVQESDSLVKDLVKDCISRKQAIDALLQMQGIIVAEDGIRKGISLAWQQIKDLPPAQPRKNGKWITVNGRFGNEVECDNCHSVFWYWMGNYSFCPSCGARMEGESDES